MAENFGSSFSSSLFGLSWNAFWRTIVRLSIILIIVLAAVYIVVSHFIFNGSISEIALEGDSIHIKIRGKDNYYYLFPTCELWANPKLHFEEGDIITIQATGKYYPAIHHLIDYAKDDTGRIYPWLGPEGMPMSGFKRNADRLRAIGCPKQNANYGALLIRVIYSKSEDTLVYRGDEELRYTFKENGGDLRFGVNEMMLNSSDTNMKDIYLISEKEDKAYVRKRPEKVQRRAWEKILQEGTVKELWSDDNVGELLIAIQQTKKSKNWFGF